MQNPLSHQRLMMPKRLLMTGVFAVALSACAGQVPTEGEIKKQNSSAKVAQMIRVAETTAAGGDFASAAGMYQRAVKMAPNDPAPLVGLGDTLAAARENRDAVQAYRQALALDSSHIGAHYGYGRVLMRMGRPELAVGELKIVFAERPKDIGLLNVLGIALDLTGAHSEAQARYGDALSLNANHPASRNNMGLSQALTGDFDGAVQTLRDLANDPISMPRHRLNLALVYGLAGQIVEARRTASRLLRPSEVENNLAYYKRLRAMTSKNRAAAVFRIKR